MRGLGCGPTVIRLGDTREPHHGPQARSRPAGGPDAEDRAAVRRAQRGAMRRCARSSLGTIQTAPA
jgi:hypothetical protein